jgi:membrane associated rhomboid family serine protease
MVGTDSMIPARSRAQAHDWSLVLLSQGIESSVEPPLDQAGWRIAVAPEHFGRAVRALRQYTIENKKRPHLHSPAETPVFDWGNTWFFVLLVVLFVLAQTVAPYLKTVGIMDRNAFLAGEWWRPFTAVFLHHDPPHLIANVVVGMLFVGLAGGLFGPVRAFCLSFASGAIANVARSLFDSKEYWSLGASGMVMGALGLITASSLIHRPLQPNYHTALRGIAGGILLLILLGFDPHPQTDVLAHVAGFLAGFFLGALSLFLSSKQASGSSAAQGPVGFGR